MTILGPLITLLVAIAPTLIKWLDARTPQSGGQDEFDKALASNNLELASINLRGLSDRGKAILRLRQRAIRRRAERGPSDNQQATIEGAPLRPGDVRDSTNSALDASNDVLQVDAPTIEANRHQTPSNT